MKTLNKLWLWILLVGIGTGLRGPAVAQESGVLPYVAPEYGEPLWPRGEGSMDPSARDALNDVLMAVVEQPEIGGFTRGKALAIVFALGNRSDVIETDFKLRHGGLKAVSRPRPVPDERGMVSLAESIQFRRPRWPRGCRCTRPTRP